MKKILSYFIIIILGISFMWAGLVNTGNDNNIINNNNISNNISQNQSYNNDTLQNYQSSTNNISNNISQNQSHNNNNTFQNCEVQFGNGYWCANKDVILTECENHYDIHSLKKTCNSVGDIYCGKCINYQNNTYSKYNNNNSSNSVVISNIHNNSNMNNTISCKQYNEKECQEQKRCNPEYKKVKSFFNKGYKNIFLTCNNKINKILTNNTKEQVKCVFANSNKIQKCYTNDEKFECSGTKICVTDVNGKKGEKLTWKSTCGDYSYTIIDGTNKYAKFKCQSTNSNYNNNGSSSDVSTSSHNDSNMNNTLNCTQYNEQQCQEQDKCTPEYKKVKSFKGYKNTFLTCNNN